MKKTILIQWALMIAASFSLWMFAFPHTLWWMEGNSFFSTLPDFRALQIHWPEDIAKYIGAFFLQFYRYTYLGAFFQTLLVWFVLACGQATVFRLFRNKELLWLAFLPAVWTMYAQIKDITLEETLVKCFIALTVAILCFCLTSPQRYLKTSFSGPMAKWLSLAMPVLILGGGIALITTNTYNRSYEAYHRMDHWAERREWDKVLKETTPDKTRKNQTKLRYALLALSEKGTLTQEMFRYYPHSPEDFLFERKDDQLSYNFNTLFFDCLGVHNEVLHHSYQSGMISPLGYSFRTLRRFADEHLQLGNYLLAAKYMEILKHTPANSGWVQQRLPILERIKHTEGTRKNEAQPFFIGARTFVSDMARMLDRYPDHKKAADYLLCGLLLAKDLPKFQQLFPKIAPRIYPPGTPLPRYYEEALLVLSMENPEILKAFPVSKQTQEDFQMLVSWMDQKRADLIRMKLGYCFWTYLLERK